MNKESSRDAVEFLDEVDGQKYTIFLSGSAKVVSPRSAIRGAREFIREHGSVPKIVKLWSNGTASAE